MAYFHHVLYQVLSFCYSFTGRHGMKFPMHCTVVWTRPGGTAGRLERWLHPVTSQLPQGRCHTNHHHRSNFSGVSGGRWWNLYFTSFVLFQVSELFRDPCFFLWTYCAKIELNPGINEMKSASEDIFLNVYRNWPTSETMWFDRAPLVLSGYVEERWSIRGCQ